MIWKNNRLSSDYKKNGKVLWPEDGEKIKIEEVQWHVSKKGYNQLWLGGINENKERRLICLTQTTRECEYLQGVCDYEGVYADIYYDYSPDHKRWRSLNDFYKNYPPNLQGRTIVYFQDKIEIL